MSTQCGVLLFALRSSHFRRAVGLFSLPAPCNVANLESQRANATKRRSRWRACTTTHTGFDLAARTRKERPTKSDAVSGGHFRSRRICDDVLQSAAVGAVAPSDGQGSASCGLNSSPLLGAKPLAAAQRSRGFDARPRWQSTSTPTATATALALAMVLAFAPMGDAKAAAGDCYGVRYDGLCFGVGSIEVSKQHISSRARQRGGSK